MARVGLDLQRFNDLTGKNIYCKENNIDKSTTNHNDIDELISDKGITYNTKKHSYYQEYNLYKSEENYNEDLFEQFKQFILFQKRIQDK